MGRAVRLPLLTRAVTIPQSASAGKLRSFGRLVDPRRKAPGLGIVDVDIFHVAVSEHPVDQRFNSTSLNHIRIQQHSLLVESAKRQQTAPEHLRNIIDGYLRFLGKLTLQGISSTRTLLPLQL